MPWMATQTGFVCKQCLSRNKFCQDLLRHRCKDTQKHNFKLTTSKVYVRWNGTYLEPAIRTLPQDTPLPPGHNIIVICQGGPHCRLEQCIFAHDTKELKRLNEQLKQTRRDNFKGDQTVSCYNCSAFTLDISGMKPVAVGFKYISI